MVLIDKPEVGRTDAALLVEELIEIYTTPTPKGCREAKKVICIDWLDVLFIKAGVQYLYPKPKHESYSNMTYYNLWYKTFLTWDNLDPNLSLFVESDMSFPTPNVAHCCYLLTSFEESQF